jgi:hypothetical protein
MSHGIFPGYEEGWRRGYCMDRVHPKMIFVKTEY